MFSVRHYTFLSHTHARDSPVILIFRASNNNLPNSQTKSTLLQGHRRDLHTSPFGRGVTDVHSPSTVPRVIPNRIHGARSMRVWPRTGYTVVSSTPPSVLAPIPAQTTSVCGIGVPNAPSRSWEICCTLARTTCPPCCLKLCWRY